MKKFTKFIIIAYLIFVTNNSYAVEQGTKLNENEKLLKIGVLLPLSGKYKNLGQSFLKAIQLALYDLNTSIENKVKNNETFSDHLLY